jgi:hypothetical protein
VSAAVWLEGIQTVLFVIAVAGAGAAIVLSRRERSQPVRESRPISRGVLRGWAVFVVLNTLAGVSHPLLACRLFVRAYLMRLTFLRLRGRGKS